MTYLTKKLSRGGDASRKQRGIQCERSLRRRTKKISVLISTKIIDEEPARGSSVPEDELLELEDELLELEDELLELEDELLELEEELLGFGSGMGDKAKSIKSKLKLPLTTSMVSFFLPALTCPRFRLTVS